MTKEEYFNELQKMFGDDFDKLGITMSLPKSVMKRNAEKFLKVQLEQNQKRLESKGLISASRDTALRYVGKTYTSPKSKFQLNLEKKSLAAMKFANNLVKAYSGDSFDEIISKVSKSVANEFKKAYGENFDTLYNDAQKISLLNKFIDSSIARLNKKIAIRSAFNDKKQELTKLNGIYLDKIKMGDSIMPVAMKDPEYQKIMERLDLAQKVFDTQNEKYNSYLKELNELYAGTKNRDIRNRMSDLERYLKTTKVNLDAAKKELKESENARKEYEQNFAENEKQKSRAKSKNSSHNKAHDMLDDYNFSKDGELIQKGTTEAKEINLVVNEFMSRFRSDMDLSIRENDGVDTKICDYLKNIDSKLKDDLGIFLSSSRAIQRAFDSRAKELAEGNPTKKVNDIIENMKLSKAVFKNNYDTLKKDLSKIGVDIKSIERKSANDKN